MDLSDFYSIAYVECNSAQSAANLKFWFDNKYAYSRVLYAHIHMNQIFLLLTSKAVGRPLPSQIQLKAIPSALYPKVSLVHPFLYEEPLITVLYLNSEPPARGDGRLPLPSTVTVGQPSVAARATFRGGNPGGMGRGMMSNGGAGGGTGGMMSTNMATGNMGMGNMGMGNMGMGVNMNGMGMGAGMNVGGNGGGGNFMGGGGGRGGFQGGRGGVPQGPRGGMSGRGGMMGGGGGMGTNL